MAAGVDFLSFRIDSDTYESAIDPDFGRFPHKLNAVQQLGLVVLEDAIERANKGDETERAWLRGVCDPHKLTVGCICNGLRINQEELLTKLERRWAA